MNCSRTRCDYELDGGFYRIWNNTGNSVPYRDYCLKCGRKIIEYNSRDEIKLRFEVIFPGTCK